MDHQSAAKGSGRKRDLQWLEYVFFTFLTLMVTLIHWDRFHFDSPIFITQAGTWAWLGIYISFPVALGILWVALIRQSGVDLLRKVMLPIWICSTQIVQGAIMLLFGGAMLLLPETIIPSGRGNCLSLYPQPSARGE